MKPIILYCLGYVNMNFMLIITSLVVIVKCIHSEENKERKFESGEQFYMKIFKRRRAEQLDAIKSLKKSLSFEKQQSMINLMAEKIFAVIQDSRAFIESSPYIPGISQFPSDEKIRDALSNILENTALFCELVLRFPNTVIAILKSNNNWNILLQWSIAFCSQVKDLLDKSTVKLLYLASQELNHIKREPNYINPYRDNLSETHQSAMEDSKIIKKVKKKIKKGPKLIYSHSEF